MLVLSAEEGECYRPRVGPAATLILADGVEQLCTNEGGWRCARFAWGGAIEKEHR